MSYIVVFDKVKETTTTTGTSNLTLGGAVTGFRDFGGLGIDEYSIFSYEVHAVDGSGIPTGEYEVGIGSWDSGTDALIRRKVTASSNSGALVSFSAGTKYVSIAFTSAQAAGLLAVTASLDLYVDASASGTFSGLDTSDEFSTVQGAVNFAAKFCFCPGGGEITIHVAAGTYAEDVVIPAVVSSGGATPQYKLWGAGATTIIQSLTFINSGYWEVDGVKTEWIAGDGALTNVYVDNISFSGSSGDHHLYAKNGAAIEIWGCTLLGSPGSGKAHIACDSGGRVKEKTATLGANVTVSAWAECKRGAGFFDFTGSTFTMGGYTSTGLRYDINGNGVCYTNGGGASFLPGTSAGTTATGGQYL